MLQRLPLKWTVWVESHARVESVVFDCVSQVNKIFDFSIKILMIKAIKICFSGLWNADLLLYIEFEGRALSGGRKIDNRELFDRKLTYGTLVLGLVLVVRSEAIRALQMLAWEKSVDRAFSTRTSSPVFEADDAPSLVLGGLSDLSVLRLASPSIVYLHDLLLGLVDKGNATAVSLVKVLHDKGKMSFKKS